MSEIDNLDQETSSDDLAEEIDVSRRYLIGGLGLLSSTLGACSSTEEGGISPQGQLPDGHQSGRMGDAQNINCGCMPPGATPPLTTPAIGATQNNLTPLATAFTSLGPGTATVSVTDMMAAPVVMSDGVPVSVWSFVAANSGFNSDRITPGPVIECIEGAPMSLTLQTMHAHSIHLHGLDVDTQNDGVPSTSFYVVGSMMGGAPPMIPPAVAGYPSRPSPFTYQFTPQFAGTYMYHCHVDTVLHMEMGMAGTIVVRPANGDRNSLWTGGPTFNKEYIWHLQTFDSAWHSQSTSSAVTARYHPDYFLINGLEGPNLLVDPATAVQALSGERILIRLVNTGYLPATASLGGAMFTVASSDGRPLLNPIVTNQVLVGPGERYDILFDMPAIATTGTIEYSSITGSSVLGIATTSITPL